MAKLFKLAIESVNDDQSMTNVESQVVINGPDQVEADIEYIDDKSKCCENKQILEEVVESVDQLQEQIDANDQALEQNPEGVTEDDIQESQECLIFNLAKLGMNKDSISKYRISNEANSTKVERLIAVNEQLKLAQEAIWNTTKSIFLSSKKDLESYSKSASKKISSYIPVLNELKEIYKQDFEIDQDSLVDAISKKLAVYYVSGINGTLDIKAIMNLLKNSSNLTMKHGIHGIKALPSIEYWQAPGILKDSKLVDLWPKILKEVYNKTNLDALSKSIIEDLYEYGSTALFARGGANLENLGPIGVTDIDGDQATLIGGDLVVSPRVRPNFNFFVVNVNAKITTVNGIKSSKDLAKFIPDIIAAVNGFNTFISTLNRNYNESVDELVKLKGKWTDVSKVAMIAKSMYTKFMESINREALGKIDQYLNTITALIFLLNACKK